MSGYGNQQDLIHVGITVDAVFFGVDCEVLQDGRTYRATEPQFRAIHEAIQRQPPNLGQIDFVE